MRRGTLNGGAGPNFIGCWRLDNDGLCERIVAFFEENRQAQAPGRTGTGRVDESYKQSLDIYIRPKDLRKPECEALSEYIGLLHDCFRDYTGQWDFLKTFLKTVPVGGFVEASSGLLLIFAAGAVLGPLLVSPFMTLRTPYALFFWIALFQIVLALFVAHRMRKRERVPEAERGEFFDSLNEIQRVFHSDTPSGPEDRGEAQDEPGAKDAPEGETEAPEPESKPKGKDGDPPAQL